VVGMHRVPKTAFPERVEADSIHDGSQSVSRRRGWAQSESAPDECGNPECEELMCLISTEIWGELYIWAA